MPNRNKNFSALGLIYLVKNKINTLKVAEFLKRVDQILGDDWPKTYQNFGITG